TKPKRISLPTYPFARERYWISETQGKGIIARAEAAVSMIHPMLHENTSDLSEQRFTSTFTGKEFFLNDHQVKGEKVLPGVCYLEMARAAVEKASGGIDDGAAIHLKNIVWTQPIVVSGVAHEVHIGLFGEDDGRIQYKVYTEPGNGEEPIVHSQGIAEFKTKEETPPLDIQKLQSQMKQGILDAENCYRTFKKMGLDFGPGHQGIKEVNLGENQLLAKLSLPHSVQNTQDGYVLHPSLMDSALQPSIGLMLKNSAQPDGSEAPHKLSLPFALESLGISAPCAKEMYAWLRYSGGSEFSDKDQKLDIDLCDEQGVVCVKMRGFSSRVLEGEVGTLKAKDTIGTLLATPVWKETEINSQNQKTVELSQSATEFGFSTSTHKPKTVQLQGLSELEAITIEPLGRKKASPVNLPVESLSSLTDSSLPVEKLQPEPSPQHLISKAALQDDLKTSLAKELYMNESDIDIEKAFIEMGLDSIVGVEWINAINQKYKINIAATKVYDYPTIKELAGFLKEKYFQEIQSSIKAGVPLLSLDTKTSTSLLGKTLKKHSRALFRKHSGIFYQNTMTATPLLQSSRSIEELKKQWEQLGDQYGFVHSKGTGVGSGVSRSSLNQKNGDDSIAIIGKSGQFPQSGNLKEFWKNLVRGKDCITGIPKDRWSIDEYYHAGEAIEGKTNCKWMGALKNADKFDPLFFNIPPAEAEWMDPQQRVFLESAWSCIEDAGIDPETLSSSQCGVFVGCETRDYGRSVQGDQFTSKNLTGASISILSSRISYLLNLKGPCLAIDTACSSSLVAIAEACSSLMNRTSNLALAGGVCILSGPSLHIMASQSGMLSKDGRCFTFDTHANGFVPGEGVGVILLKRLEDALRDKDPIHGIIRGWGVNQDGKTNGITAPSVNSQILLEKEVYRRFGIDPASISLAETHGTGTKLGDPIEVEALLESLQSQTSNRQPCALGSVKSNIGHLLTAAGVSGVIKVLLCLRHKKLVPLANFQTLNPHISLKNSRFYINTKLQDWKSSAGIPRRACVSSFGFSGTNAHLVIEEPPLSQTKPIVSTSVFKAPLFIPLSAKNKERLYACVEQLHLFLQQNETKEEEERERNPEYRIEDVAYTLQVGRSAMEERVAFIVKDESDLLEKLRSFLDSEESIKDCYQGSVKRREEHLVALFVDEDMSQTIASWITKKKYSKLMKLWVKGLVFDWNQLYGDSKPQRVSLPTYPFARERYWITETQKKRIIVTAGSNFPRIHPLLHENTSDLSEQRFTSTFTGEEFFLKDHQVKGEKVLPGVCYLEM
ncbi:MAG: hypothetical protein GY941_16170, partial [Planctomycetes bacterium]|nr:hypothetical protein [Planctomycetota bacterium]